VNHNINATFNLADAGGPIVRGVSMLSCNGSDLAYELTVPFTRADGSVESLKPYCGRFSKACESPAGRNPGSGTLRPLRIQGKMSKRAPSTAQLLVIAGFALSCFGILLFLWITFGGPTPFKAKPYQIKVPFNEATQLAQQSDVRISGVSVGKVQTIEVSPDGQQALATIDIEDKYAPIPKATRAILRTKTLLGETYVELTPGDADGQSFRTGPPWRSQRRRIGRSSTRSSAPSTNPPGGLQGVDAGSAVSIEGRGQSFSTSSPSSNRPSANSTGCSASSTRSASRSSSCSATAPSTSAPCAAAKVSWPT
jgi:hypothetical protein